MGSVPNLTISSCILRLFANMRVSSVDYEIEISQYFCALINNSQHLAFVWQLHDSGTKQKKLYDIS